MTELEFYKFINNNKIEYHSVENNGEKDYILFLNFDEAQQLSDLCSETLFDGEGLIAVMKKGYLCIYASQICEHYNIDIDNILKD